jgi:hypothetical protein
MMGCLTAPFRMLGCLVVVGALVAGWLYRDRLLNLGGGLIGRGASVAGGHPSARALGSAKSKADSLARGRADSVVLGAAEMASLISDGLAPAVRGELDSLEVRLEDGKIDVTAQVSTARLPRELIGPLGFFLRDRERVGAAGAVRVAGPGRGEWMIGQVDVRGLPIPTSAVTSVLGRAFQDPGRAAVPVRLPPGVREIHIRRSGVTLVGASKR